MIIGHDGAGAMDEFGPDSMWAYIHDNPEDDAAYAEGRMPPAEGEEDAADWWKNGGEGQ
jgi:hypothetical protein